MEFGPARQVRIAIRFLFLAALISIGAVQRAHAQDPFEIRVEQYEEPAFGAFTFEEHLNGVGSGTTIFDGSVAPTDHQFHMSSEFTAGITDHLSLGLMLMAAAVPGRGGLGYAGWRILPHFYVPDRWHLPVRIGLTAEFSFQRTLFDESARTLELRPIFEERMGRMQLDVNGSVERPLTRLPIRSGWSFEPSFRFAYDATKRVTASLEYFGATGLLADMLPLKHEVHQLYPGAVWKLNDSLLWDFGVGAGLTPAGNRLVYKTRLEFSFERKGRKEKTPN
jgi:hypothetical protein